MKIELITFKSKTWGVIPHQIERGHFFTGYVGEWQRYYLSEFTPEDAMQIGHNVIITGDFRLEGMHRGHSAANFNGHFRGHDKVGYTMSMDGMLLTLKALQDDQFAIVDGYVSGRWTIAKKGMNVFLHPYIN